jgi:hypothetical protein
MSDRSSRDLEPVRWLAAVAASLLLGCTLFADNAFTPLSADDDVTRPDGQLDASSDRDATAQHLEATDLGPDAPTDTGD